VEKEGTELVLSTPKPSVDLVSASAALAKRLGTRASVGVLHDMLVVDVDAANLVDVATVIRDEEPTKCDLYSVNAGVDTGSELRSVTFVRGTTTHVFVMLRTRCSETAHVPSLVSVWEGANWAERETYDMFGIEFDGHPDLRRIFLEESFPGHPLRKSFLPPRSDARGG
jgi:NADH:ubiquinone oxidoreductase subunit C